jgi:hypothetical protein
MPQKTLLQSAGDGTAVAAGYVLSTTTINQSSASLSAGTGATNIFSSVLPAGVYLVTGRIQAVWSATPTTSNFPLMEINGNYIKTSSTTVIPQKPNLSNGEHTTPIFATFTSNGSTAFNITGTNFSGTTANVTYNTSLDFLRIA